MAPQAQTRLTEADYLALERASPERHQFLAGEMFAIGGASERHNLIVTNLVVEIGSQLRGGLCRLYASDMRVKVEATGLSTYPDLVAVCEEPRFADEHQDTLLNPVVIIEVLSPSTERCDRGEKFEHYRQIGSLREVLLVAQDRPHVDQYLRREDGRWMLADWSGPGARLELAALGAELTLERAYERVPATS